MKPKLIFLGGLLFYCLNSFAIEIDFFVHFEKNQFVLNDSIQQRLDTWALTHYNQRHHKVYLYGHTDTDAENDYNEKLSANRNKSVRQILEKRGFDNVVDKHFGETRPICWSSEESCMAKNRRVEIHLIDDQEELWQDNVVLPTPVVNHLNAQQENILGFPEGTIIKIPENCFVNNQGELAQEVRLEVRELYDIKSCLSGRVSTQCGDRLLESGGMIEVRAYSGQEELNLTDGSAIEIAFANNSQNQNGMQTFYGKVVNGVMQWETTPKLAQSSNADIEATTFSFSLAYPKNNVICQKGNLLIFPKKKYNGIIIYRTEENKEFLSRFMSTPEEKIYSSDYTRLKLEAEKTKELVLKEIKRIAQEEQEMQTLYNRQREEKYAQKVEKYNTENLPEGMNLETYLNTKDSLNKAMLSSLSAMQLGWINCDRFLSKDRKLSTVVCSGDKIDPDYSFLIIPSTFSIMRGEISEKNVIFKNMPVNVTKHVIYQEKMIDGKIKFSIQSIPDGESTCAMDKFFLVSEDEAQKEIDRLLLKEL